MKTAKTKRWLGVVLAVLLIALICPIIASASTAQSDSIDFPGAQLRLDKAGIRFVGEFDVNTHTSNANGLTVEYGFLVLPTVAITNYGQTLTYENTATLKIATTDADQLLSAGDERLNGITPTTAGNKMMLAVMKDMPEEVFKSQISFSVVPFVAYLDGTTADQIFYGTTKEYNGVEIANKAVNPDTTQESLEQRIAIVKKFQGVAGFLYTIKDLHDCETLGHDYNTNNICKYCDDQIVATTGLQYAPINGGWQVSGYVGENADVVIPAQYQGKPVVSIGEGAFYESTMQSVTIPNSVKTIGEAAFLACNNLTSISVEAGNSVYCSVGNCLIETSSKTLIAGCKNSVIPTGGLVVKIGDGAFFSTGLQSITIPSSVTDIGVSAFGCCFGLKNVTFESGSQCIGIGEGAFVQSAIESITIPSSVRTIGRSAFGECSTLGSIYFEAGSQCVSIGEFAFANCIALKQIVIPKGVEKIDAFAFYNSGLKSIAFEAGSVCGSICEAAFSQCAALESVTIPSSVKTIESQAFAECGSLGSIYFEAGSQCVSIGLMAFNKCTALTEIVIPKGVKKIDENTFMECSGLRNVIFEATSQCATISSYAFMGCISLQSIKIPSSVTTIGSYAFLGCWSLQSITFEDTTTWYPTSNSSYTGGTQINVTDPAQNATYFESTYYNYYWYKQ